MELFKAKLGSPVTQLADNITNTQTTISLVNADVLPAAPNIATIGTGVNAETIRYSGKTLNTLTGVTRGFTGVAKAWTSGQPIARIFTQYDHDSLVESVETHEADYASKQFGQRPYTSTAIKTYYIDAVSGDDNNDGLSAIAAFKTWGKMYSLIPRNITHNLTIRIIGNLTGVELLIDGVQIGNATLLLRGDTNNASNHTILRPRIVSVIGDCQINYFTLTASIPIQSSRQIFLRYLTSNLAVGSCVTFTATSGSIWDCSLNTSGGDALLVTNTCHIWSRNNTGNGSGYGLAAQGGSTICKDGTQPTGSIANEQSIQGALIR